MRINNIYFDIKNIDITNNQYVLPVGSIVSPSSWSNWAHQFKEIRITAQTANSNYMALDHWCNNICKKDINYNGIYIAGIFPIDYTFNQYSIDVTFSADYISGDLELFNKQKLRKEKLKKIAQCQ